MIKSNVLLILFSSALIIMIFCACSTEDPSTPNCEQIIDDFCVTEINAILTTHTAMIDSITGFDLDRDGVDDVGIKYFCNFGNTFTYKYFYLIRLNESASIASTLHTDTLMRCHSTLGFLNNPIYNLGGSFSCSSGVSSFEEIDTIYFPNFKSSLTDLNDTLNFIKKPSYFFRRQWSPNAKIRYNFWDNYNEQYIFIQLEDEKKGYIKLSAIGDDEDLIIHEIACER